MQWVITQLKRNASNGGVVTVFWSAVKVVDNIHGQVDGQEDFLPDPQNPNFVPFEQLTQEKVLEWILAKIDQQAVETEIDQKIQNVKNPPLLFGVPWKNKGQ